MKIYIKDNFITDNSKECMDNCLFLKTDTNSVFCNEALKNGAKIINVDECMKILNIDKNIKIIGITGTNGKTTTAYILYETLRQLNKSCGISGTRGAYINNQQIDEKGLTTSPILKTIEYLKKASEEKCEYFVMEVSSHSIAQNRIEGLEFTLKIFTNLSQDHLDYHKNMKEYSNVKSSFLNDDSYKIINSDDKLINYNRSNAFTYGLMGYCDFIAKDISFKNGIKAAISNNNENEYLNSPLQGEFNLYNLLAAISAIKILTKHSLNTILKAVNRFQGVDGRMQVVSQKPLVIVDFAHTPDGMEKVLHSLRHLKMIVVFGAGGDRDKTKRPIMGQIATRYARQTIITSDNPRGENPQTIIDEICVNLKKDFIKQVDRRKAIQIALENLKNDEALVILGKGDEQYQEIQGTKHPFSDKEIVIELIEKGNL